MRHTLFLLLCALGSTLGGCKALHSVGSNLGFVSQQEQKEIDNDFRPRVKPVSGSTMVRVALLRPAASDSVNGVALFDAWRAHFLHDRKFDVMPQAKVDRAEYSGEETYYRLGSATRIALKATRKGDRLHLTATTTSNVTGETERHAVDGPAGARFEALIDRLAALVKLALLG